MTQSSTVSRASTSQEDDWIEMIQKNLSSDYIPIAESSLAAIRVVVYAHKKHMPAITFVEYGK